MRYYYSLILLFIIVMIRVFTYCHINFYDNSIKCPAQITIQNKFFQNIRTYSINLIQQYFPSPHSELLLGMVLGIDELDKVPIFQSNLKRSGTIHVVVVSGFNISLVFGLVISFIGTKYKLKNLLLAQLITLCYCLLSGFQPPVIRAFVMGSIVSWSTYYGRSLDGLRVLIFAFLLILMIYPGFVISLSFWLSSLATLGLLLCSKLFETLIGNESFISKDLSTTVSAQVFVWPLISYFFGTFSLVSFVVNPLILWTVSISTMLGGLFIIFASLNTFLARVGVILLFPFLDIFVKTNNFFSKFSFATINFKISLITFILYYVITISTLIYLKKVFKI